jgi:hypothetical protein
MNDHNYTSTPPISHHGVHKDKCTGRKILTDLDRSLRIPAGVVLTDKISQFTEYATALSEVYFSTTNNLLLKLVNAQYKTIPIVKGRNMLLRM